MWHAKCAGYKRKIPPFHVLAVPPGCSCGTVSSLCSQGTLLHSVCVYQDPQVPPCRAAPSQAGTTPHSCTGCFLPVAELGLFLSLLNLKTPFWPPPPAYTDPQEQQYNAIPLLAIICNSCLPFPHISK